MHSSQRLPAFTTEIKQSKPQQRKEMRNRYFRHKKQNDAFEKKLDKCLLFARSYSATHALDP
jgi:hypothetical protein